MLKVGFDVGGILSKDNRWRELAIIITYSYTETEVYVITDMHDKYKVLQVLSDNDLDFIPPERVFCADYARWGEACKAVLLKELQIDIFFDDFVGYLQWDSKLGPAPLRCLVMPDWNKPYYHDKWRNAGEADFGRRVAPKNLGNEAHD